MNLPEVVSRADWRSARVELLAEEKAMTRARDALNTKRRELPMVEIDKDYLFKGPGHTARLLDLFDARRQLVIRHFMFDPRLEDGCPSCTASVDEISDGHLDHLRSRETSLVVISRAPLDKIERYKARRGWTLPWYSSRERWTRGAPGFRAVNRERSPREAHIGQAPPREPTPRRRPDRDRHRNQWIPHRLSLGHDAGVFAAGGR